VDRKEFFRRSLLLAIGAAGGAAFLEACSKQSSQPSGGGTVDFTIDISTAQYNSLQTNGGFVYDNNVIIARDSNGNFIGLSDVCTHQGCTISFDGTSQFPCPCHGSIFDENGNVVRGPAASAVKKYNTTLTGTKLRIYG